MKSGVVEFLTGQNKGISWRFKNRDQLHRGLQDERAKAEPYQSLSPGKTVTERSVKAGYDERLAPLEEVMKALLQGE